LGLLAVAAVAGIFALKWADSPAGRMWLADRGSPQAQRWASERLQRAQLDALTAAGVSPDSLTVVAGGDEQLTRIDAVSAAPLLDLNIALTAAAQGAGGVAHRGAVLEGDRGRTLDMVVGTRARPTHRVVVRRSLAADAPAPPPPPPLPKGVLAIVVDDWGYNLGPLATRLLQLDAPLTCAILPELPYSQRALNEIVRHGKQPLLHLPMEPETADLGRGTPAVMVGMQATAVDSVVNRCLDGLPGVIGVNNHMGSKATQHREEMLAVMRALDARGLFFLDSMTSPGSVAYEMAREVGLPAAQNDLFLDVDTSDPAVVEARLLSLVEKARRHGRAIGICHLNEASVQVLERILPQLNAGEVRAVPLSELLTPPSG
jgi:polysaccharide deacetylase 2 family uncharacterized protein YibQ